MVKSTPAHSRPISVVRFTKAPSGRVTPLVVHEHAALTFVLEGHAVHEQRGRFDVRAGDVLIVPAGEAHRAIRRTRVTAWGVGICATCFAPSELANLFDPFERARSGAAPIVAIPPDRRAHVDHLLRELYAETRDPRSHGELVQKSLLALVLAEVTRAAKVASIATPHPSTVADALRFIERRCLKPISLVDVARAVRRSPAHLTTIVKRATGKSVGEWIIAARLAEAQSRLLHTDEMVDVIAERVGYADATHFIRLFRRTHGQTPAAWRAAQRAR